MKRRATPALVAALLLSGASDALAGGMFLPARGARALGRAGSFVAGADDVGALYYNPAGLGLAPRGQVLIDAGLVVQDVEFARVDSGGVTQPAVSPSHGFLPLPFIGLSYRPRIGNKNEKDDTKRNDRLTLALGAFAPYTDLHSYSLTGPQRYSFVSLAGSLLVTAELALAVKVSEHFYLGAGFQNMFVSIDNTVVLSSCASQLNCAPEQPRFDSPTQAKAASWFTPSGNFGALFVSRLVRVGLSLQLPYFVRASGTVKSRLPSDPQFDGARVEGEALDVEFDLPLVLRGGIELRPVKMARVELGVDYEAWRMHDVMRFVPRDVRIANVVGVGTYVLGPMSIRRGMQDTVSAHVGAEIDVIRLLTLRAGYLFESSAVPDETVTVLTPDNHKHLVALGLALNVGPVRLELSYGHFFQHDRTVTNSQSMQLNPIQPGLAVAVGNGTYKVATDVAAAGIAGRF